MLRAIYSAVTGAVLALCSPVLTSSGAVEAPAADSPPGQLLICPSCGRAIGQIAIGSWHCAEEKAGYREYILRPAQERIVLPYSPAPKSASPVSPITEQELERVKGALTLLKGSMSVEEVETRTGLSRFAVCRAVGGDIAINGTLRNVNFVSINYDLGNGHRLKLEYDRKFSALKFHLATIVLDRALWVFNSETSD